MTSDKEDEIELVQFSSSVSTKSYGDRRKKLRNNKIASPPTSTPTKNHNVIKEDVFTVKPRKTLPPVVHSKHQKRKKHVSTSDITSESSDVSDFNMERPMSETTSAFTFKSDQRSYREKIKDRFKSVKHQAGQSLSKAHKSTFRGRSERVMDLNRTIEMMRRESRNVDEELMGYRNNRLREEVGYITKADAYSFFCDQNRTETLEESFSVEATLPELLEFNIKLSEQENLWIPSGKPLDIEVKISKEELPSLEEEFRILLPPNVPKSHLNIMEERLLRADGRKWFNSEGNMDVLEDPCMKTSFCPISTDRSGDLTVYVPPTLDVEYNFEEVVVYKENILQLQIYTIDFKHHPLFSVEHVFQQKLIDLYELYLAKNTANKFKRTQDRLEAARKFKEDLEDSSDEDVHEKIESNVKEIKKLREALFKEGKELRKILKNVLYTWKMLKKIRELQGYSNTSVKLMIRKEEVDEEEEKQCLESMKEQTFMEIISEYEEDYHKKMEEYQEVVQKWKGKKSSDEKPVKPHKNFDDEVIKEEIERQFSESFKPPGEPLLHFALNYENSITDDVEDAQEKLRRNAVNATKIFFKIICNKIEVCKSKIVSLNDSFSCNFEESFSIQLITIPETLSIHIYEQPGNLLKRKLGEIKIKLPKSSGTSKISEMIFKKDEIIHYKHSGIGSGISLKSILEPSNLHWENDEKILNSTGSLTYKIFWESIQISSSQVDVPENFIDPSSGSIDVTKLKELIKEAPEDQQNSVLLEYIKNHEDSTRETEDSHYFRLNPYLKPFEFCHVSKIQNNLRFKILELRNRNEPEFVGMIVPNRLKEIPLGILSAYKRRLNEEQQELLDYENEDESVDSRRSYGRKYLKQIHTKVFQKCRSTENNLSFEDVIDEKYLTHFALFIKTFVLNFLNWFKFQPTIRKPLPKIATKKLPSTNTSQEQLPSDSKVIINVISAINLPSRTETDLKPLVMVVYQNMIVETAISQNENPVWNEELVLPLGSSHTDYLNPNSLSGMIYINIYDIILIDEEVEERRIWLGSVEIPISAICHSGKMEGIFKIKTPELLFGYDQEMDKYHLSSSKINTTQTSYLSLKLTIEPNIIPKLNASMDELQCNEPPYIREHILKWNENYNNNFTTRKFSALAIDFTGKTTCITRYVRALEPPQINADGFEVTADQCARYVSMIPFTECNKFYQNVWLTTDQLLKLMIGSVVDHAVALTCYLTALNLDVWLILGFGIPHGSTAYVLLREFTRDSQLPEHYIYDVVTSIKYNVTDPFCPLQSVFCVVNQHNIWANVQRNEQVSTMRFDFTRRLDWQQLFNHQISAPTNSIQLKLNYSILENVDEVEAQLYKKIRKKLMKLRKMDPTRLNHKISSTFKSILNRFEVNGMHGKTHFDDLKELRENRSQVTNGYIINTSYTNLTAVWNKIKFLEMHSIQENIDFGLAVYVHAYPNQVLSVWVFIAAVSN